MKRAIAVLLLGGAWTMAQTAPVSAPSTGPTASSGQTAAIAKPQAAVAPPSTRPFNSATSRPSQLSAEDMLRQMLQPANQGPQPLKPIPNEPPPVDITSGPGAVAPNASTQPTQIDGTTLLDRVGRLTRGADGKSFEFTLDSDDQAMSDPPLILLPNHKLQQLEDLVNNSYADVKIRVSGEITEYRGRNYLLINRWSAVQDVAQPLK